MLLKFITKHHKESRHGKSVHYFTFHIFAYKHNFIWNILIFRQPVIGIDFHMAL